jgi:hypothetical protein
MTEERDEKLALGGVGGGLELDQRGGEPGEGAVLRSVERLVVESDVVFGLDLDDLLVDEFRVGGGDRHAGQLGLEYLLDANLRGERHEENEDDEHDVDHRRDLKADVGIVGLDGELHWENEGGGLKRET